MTDVTIVHIGHNTVTVSTINKAVAPITKVVVAVGHPLHVGQVLASVALAHHGLMHNPHWLALAHHAHWLALAHIPDVLDVAHRVLVAVVHVQSNPHMVVAEAHAHGCIGRAGEQGQESDDHKAHCASLLWLFVAMVGVL
jgi:hypothetical protein